jgi:hypothetical protein
MKYKLNETISFNVIRSEGNIDRASDQAIKIARDLFGVDECGHFDNVEGASRSDSTIEIRLTDYWILGGMRGWDHVYQFEAMVNNTSR